MSEIQECLEQLENSSFLRGLGLKIKLLAETNSLTISKIATSDYLIELSGGVEQVWDMEMSILPPIDAEEDVWWNAFKEKVQMTQTENQLIFQEKNFSVTLKW